MSLRPCWLSDFLVTGKVHGPVLSDNWVGSGYTTGELAVTSSSSSFLANAHFKDANVGRPGVANYQRSRSTGISMTNNSFGMFRVTASLPALNFLIIGRVHGPVLSHNWVGAGNTLGELVVNSSLFLANAHLYFRRRNRWFCLRQQQECQDNCDQ